MAHVGSRGWVLTPSLAALLLPPFPQADLTCIPRWVLDQLPSPFPDEGGETGRGPTTLPSAGVGCTMHALAWSGAGFSPLQV